MTGFIVVYITASNEEEAEKIAGALLDAKLAACVNIMKGVRSIYRWQGKIEDEGEVLMVVKSRRALFGRLVEKVKELHSYAVPEIIALPVVEGSEEYLAWIKGETSGGA